MTAAFESPNTPPPLGVEQEADAAIPDKGRLWLEVTVAVAIFLAFCTVILLKATSLMEPDDYAYRAAIASLASGHLELTTAQYKALSTQLGGIQQWTQLPNGKWMSEKNPGYPFYAVWFWWAHALRFAPLFAGGLASTSLFIAARKWLGRWAGTYAVIFFLGSGMAMAFAYRATMPTFTDAAFLAAGAGALLWALLSSEVTLRRRTLSGVLGFVAMEWAVFMRYTDVVVLLAAIAAVLCCWRPARLKGATVAWWLGSVGVFGLGVLIFNWMVYGSPTKTGYANGEITFSLCSIIPNLKHMPAEIVRSVPALLLGLAALVWMVVRLLRSRFGSTMSPRGREIARRDGLVGGFLALGWWGLWAVYSAYTWTAQMAGGGSFKPPAGFGSPSTMLPSAATKTATSAMNAMFAATGGRPGMMPGGGMGGGGGIHVIRFYVPAIGLIALLATWLVMQLPRWLAPLLPALAVVAAYGSFHSLTRDSGHFGMPGVGSGQFIGGGAPTFPGGGKLPSGLPPGNWDGKMPPSFSGGPGGVRPPVISNGTRSGSKPSGS